MADDLDRLLDEVERRLSRRLGSGEEKPAATEEDRSAKLVMSAGSSEEDLDDIIDEICKDSSLTKTPPQLKSNFTSLTPERNSARWKKCCPVYLGGSASPSGIGTNISKRTCDQLRCTACDFRVSVFNDYIWDQSCDYLFFRNNMPELSKLRAKMIKKKGARAYACQCSWRSIDELTDLQTEQQLRTYRGPALYLGTLAVLLLCPDCIFQCHMQPGQQSQSYKPPQSPEMKRKWEKKGDMLENLLACSISLQQIPQSRQNRSHEGRQNDNPYKSIQMEM